MNATEVERYVWSHLGAPPDGRTCRLSSDFGAGEGPPPDPPPSPTDDLDQARAELQQVIELQDAARYVFRDEQPDTAWVYVGEASRIAAIVRDRLGKAPEPPPVDPPPQPTTLGAVYGTYSGHGLAVDAYPGRTEEQIQWGEHHGHPIIAPADGRVEVYSFGTPLDAQSFLRVADWSAYMYNWQALSKGWTCRAVDPLQTMFVAVWWPSAPYTVAGQRVGHLHYAHVRADIKTGPVVKGERIATVHDSGIRFEPVVPRARASHVHCCAGAGTTLSPNGDLPGRLAAIAQGWTPLTDIGAVPGPTEYQSGRYCAGRLLSDFTAAGKPIPPMPPD